LGEPRAGTTAFRPVEITLRKTSGLARPIAYESKVAELPKPQPEGSIKFGWAAGSPRGSRRLRGGEWGARRVPGAKPAVANATL